MILPDPLWGLTYFGVRISRRLSGPFKLECFDILLYIATCNLLILSYLISLNNFVWMVCGFSCTHLEKKIIFSKISIFLGAPWKQRESWFFIFLCRFWFFVTTNYFCLTSHNVGQSEHSDDMIFTNPVFLSVSTRDCRRLPCEIVR